LAGSLPVAGVFYSFQISDNVGKGIVVFLILASVWVWTIMLAKHLELLRAERVDRDFSRAFDRRSIRWKSSCAGRPIPTARWPRCTPRPAAP
jgi:hypothetical protein